MNDSIKHTRPKPSGSAWLIAGVVLVLGLGLFTQRVFMPGLTDPSVNMDFTLLPLGGRAWLKGANPYDPNFFAEQWANETPSGATGPVEGAPPPTNRGPQAMVYPAPAYMLASPIGAASIPAMRWLWNGLNLVAAGTLIVITLRLARRPLMSPLGLATIGGALAMGSIHQALRLGQTSLLPTVAALSAVLLVRTDRRLLAGITLGVGCVIKPQLSLPFLVVFIAWKEWRTATACVITGATLTAIGFARLYLAGYDAIPDWFSNVRYLRANDANPLGEGIHAHQLINLASPIADATKSGTIGAVSGYIATAVLIAAYIAASVRSKAAEPWLARLATLSITSVALLLVVYHRLYDATVLVFVLGLAMMLLARGRRWLAVVLLAPMAVLALPGPSVAFLLERNGRVPESITGTPIWRYGVLFHHTTALVLLGAAVIWVRMRLPTAEPT